MCQCPRMSAEKSPRMSAEKVRGCPRKKSANVRGKSPRMSANVHGKVRECPRKSPKMSTPQSAEKSRGMSANVRECPREKSAATVRERPQEIVRECPRMSASDCPPRTFADRVHECPRKSANVHLGDIFPWTYADIRGHSLTYNIMFFVYLKKVHVSPRVSAGHFFNFVRGLSRTFTDCRGLSKVHASPRDKSGLSRTFADTLSPRKSASVLRRTVLRRTFADLRGHTRTYADSNFSPILFIWKM